MKTKNKDNEPQVQSDIWCTFREGHIVLDAEQFASMLREMATVRPPEKVAGLLEAADAAQMVVGLVEQQMKAHKIKR